MICGKCQKEIIGDYINIDLGDSVGTWHPDCAHPKRPENGSERFWSRDATPQEISAFLNAKNIDNVVCVMEDRVKRSNFDCYRYEWSFVRCYVGGEYQFTIPYEYLNPLTDEYFYFDKIDLEGVAIESKDRIKFPEFVGDYCYHFEFYCDECPAAGECTCLNEDQEDCEEEEQVVNIV